MKLLVINKKGIIYFAMFLIIVIITIVATNIMHTIQVVKLKENMESKKAILIYIEEKRLYLFENNKCVKTYPIASGKSGWPSPVGHWKIIEKSDWGEGFGGHWLGLNVIWGKFGIHGTTSEHSIGYAASHGCIRMLNKDVKELYSLVSIGTPVTIINGPYGPFGTGFRKLAPGDRGADVLAVQQKLKELGYFKGKESGIYENDLKKAVYKFQKDKNLRIKFTITDEDYLAMGLYEFE